MPPGPKPRPVELQKALGNPRHQKLPDVVQVGGKGDIAKPAHLDTEQSRVWDEVIPLLQDANLLDRIDIFVLEGLCVQLATAREASRHIANEGYLSVHPVTGVATVSPWVRIQRDSWQQALKIAEHYGLTPVARTRLGLAVLKGRSLMQELSDL